MELTKSTVNMEILNQSINQLTNQWTDRPTDRFIELRGSMKRQWFSNFPSVVSQLAGPCSRADFRFSSPRYFRLAWKDEFGRARTQGRARREGKECLPRRLGLGQTSIRVDSYDLATSTKRVCDRELEVGRSWRQHCLEGENEGPRSTSWQNRKCNSRVLL